MSHTACTAKGLLAFVFFFALNPAAFSAETSLVLPQTRTAYQTNERIDLAAIRSGAEALAAGNLVLTLLGEDGSKLSFTFPVKDVPLAAAGKGARATEHLYLNGWLLRPGKYAIDAAVDGASGKTEIQIFSHVRKSDFRLVDWGRAKGIEQMVLGENSIGFNLFYGDRGTDAEPNFIRAGMDVMNVCTMSGAHQMDIRSECDWSDPYVTRGGTARVAQRAFKDRLQGNVPGVHFYDEPGLTWGKDPKTGEMTPHAVPWQARSYNFAFGHDAVHSDAVNVKSPESVNQWKHWAYWKLGFMNAAWKEAQFGVSQVRSDFLSLNQSQYGWPAFTDGYYFNVARCLPITSGHGGYDDYGLDYFNPSYTLEAARAREFWKPNWFLPTWYGNISSDMFRMEQYLSFQTNIQGLISPPDVDPFEPAKKPGGQGVVESNHLMMKLGTIFNTMPVTKPPVALLYSLSNVIQNQAGDMKANYAHETPHGKNLPLVYLAGKLIQQPFLFVLDEDILDGTVAADHKAIVLTSISYLDPKVVAALESYASGGGLVLLTADCTVEIKGATKMAITPSMPDQAAIDELAKTKKYQEMGPYQTMGKYFQASLPIGKAIKAELDKAGIKPVCESDLPTITCTRQMAGDIEYLFAVSATYEEAGAQRNAIKAATATLSIPDDGRPVYDALIGGEVAQFQKKDGKLQGQFRFGPGGMRVFARTIRPLGGVFVATPTVTRELTQDSSPIRLDIAATLADGKGRPLSGSAPLYIRVLDPLGVARYELYRATKLGLLSLSLPLAANDSAGQWTVAVRELLTGTEDKAYFQYAPPLHAAAVAGTPHRAVSASNDLENIFRFARTQQDVTIVCGSSPFNEAAAQRLITVLAPWGVRCKKMDLAAAAKPHALSADEAATWVGIEFGRAKPGDANTPKMSGFAVEGPVILLGNPEDNAIVKYLLTEKFLPYTPDPKNMPGNGRGLIAWQRDGVGKGQESVTLIAYDEAGMSEAVGSFYEAVAGLEALTRWALPQNAVIEPAKSAPGLHPAAPVAWSAALPDRIDIFKIAGESIACLSHDGSLSTLDLAGKITGAKVLSAAEADAMRKEAPALDAAVAKAHAKPDRIVKLSASREGIAAVAYWGGTLRVADGAGAVKTEQDMTQDITALTWAGNRLIVGLADGRVMGLDVK